MRRYVVIFGKGYGAGSETPRDGSGPVSCTSIGVGENFASSEDGTNLSGSKDGRRGYCQESPNMLKPFVACHVVSIGLFVFCDVVEQEPEQRQEHWKD